MKTKPPKIPKLPMPKMMDRMAKKTPAMRQMGKKTKGY